MNLFFVNMAEILSEVTKFVEKCLGPLGVEDISATLKSFTIQLIATLILFIFVRMFLWKPITELLEKRKEIIDDELNSAKEANAKAKSLKEEADSIYKEARSKIRTMLEEAEKNGQIRREEIINEAKDEAKRRLQTVDSEIEYEIQKKNKEIKQAIVDIAFKAAEKIIKHEVNEEKYLDLVNEMIDNEGDKYGL